MIEVKEVSNKKMQKEFLNFPLELYKDCHYYCPPLYGDEKQIFKDDYYCYEDSDAIYFNAYDDGKIVGRISGIIQKQANKKNNEKRVRFTRFDSIDNQEVANKLFEAVESWAMKNGMDTVCGPLGFNDLEREGMLIKGFREYATFEEPYNYEYYPKLMEGVGYKKEVDWIGQKLYAPSKIDEKISRVARIAMKRYKLHIPKITNMGKFIKKYEDKIFKLLDECYADLYGTVDFSKGMIESIVQQFKLVIKPQHVVMICNENDEPIAFGLGLPSLAEAVRKNKGKLNLSTLIGIFKAIKKPVIADLGIVGIKPEYQNSGIAAILLEETMKRMIDMKLEHVETNHCLEDNIKIQQIWQNFERVHHKTLRSYIKKLDFKKE